MKAPTVPNRFSVPLEKPPGPLAFVSWPLQALSLLILGGSAAAFAKIEPHLPARVPLHYGPRGVDRWGPPSELWLLAVLPALMLLVAWLIAYGVSSERWALPTSAAERYRELELRRRELMVRLGEWLALVVAIATGGFWVTIGWPGRGFEVGVSWLVVFCGPVLIAVAAWRLVLLARVDRERRRVAGTPALGTHPAAWKLGGLIYFAPDDPAVFVPKLLGIGSTVNFARPSVWLGAALLIAPALIAIYAFH